MKVVRELVFIFLIFLGAAFLPTLAHTGNNFETNSSPLKQNLASVDKTQPTFQIAGAEIKRDPRVDKKSWELLKRLIEPKYKKALKRKISEIPSDEEVLKRDRPAGPDGRALCECGFPATTYEADGVWIQACENMGWHYCDNCECY